MTWHTKQAKKKKLHSSSFFSGFSDSPTMSGLLLPAPPPPIPPPPPRFWISAVSPISRLISSMRSKSACAVPSDPKMTSWRGGIRMVSGCPSIENVGFGGGTYHLLERQPLRLRHEEPYEPRAQEGQEPEEHEGAVADALEHVGCHLSDDLRGNVSISCRRVLW